MIERNIKNIDNVSHTYEGQEILPGEYYSIANTELMDFQNSNELISDIVSGKAQMSKDTSGTNDITDINQQLNFLKGIDTQLDSDGASMSRLKVVRTGWHYQGLFGCLTTSTGEIRSKYKDGSNIPFWSVKRYDVAGVITTDKALTVKTVFEFAANHDIAIMGVKLWQAAPPPSDIEMWIHGAAHIPLAAGGSVAFVQGGSNLYHMGNGLIAELDGKAPKDILYDTTYYSHKFEIVFNHAAGVEHTLQAMFEFFKPMGV